MTAESGPASSAAWVAIAGAPALAALAFSIVIGVGWALGAQPFWAIPELTLSEAAATRDAGEVVRLVEQQHQDPNASYSVRDGVVGPGTSVSPLEAAVVVKRAEMVRLLLRLGAAPGAEERLRFACLARRGGAEDVVAALISEAERAQPLACAPASATP